MAKIMQRGVDMFPTNVNAPFLKPSIFVIGLQPTNDSLRTVERWREKGYDDVTIWGSFAVAFSRFFTRSYAVPVSNNANAFSSELLHTCETLLLTMLPNFGLLAHLRGLGFKSLSEITVDVAAKQWKIVLTVHHFPF